MWRWSVISAYLRYVHADLGHIMPCSAAYLILERERNIQYGLFHTSTKRLTDLESSIAGTPDVKYILTTSTAHGVGRILLGCRLTKLTSPYYDLTHTIKTLAKEINSRKAFAHYVLKANPAWNHI